MSHHDSDQEQYCAEECDLRLVVQSDQERQDLEAMLLLINQCLGCGEVYHGELTLTTCKAGWTVCPTCYNEYAGDCYYEMKSRMDSWLIGDKKSIPELPEAEIGVITWK